MNSAKPAKSKADRMATVAELIDLGVSLMKRGRDDLEKGHCSGAQCFRDGLMIAALAMRPLRRRNFAALQIGKTFLPDCEHYRVSFKGKETKTGRGIEFDYPPSVSAPFAFYLSEARPVLLKRSNTPDDGFLWVGRRGRAMDGEEITQRIGNVTRRQLGRRVSPHLFRDCVATDIAIHDPKHIGIVKSVLGHATLASSQKYYNQATSFEAARRHQSIIAALRGAT
jgi:integrase/recombinase XerC